MQPIWFLLLACSPYSVQSEQLTGAEILSDGVCWYACVYIQKYIYVYNTYICMYIFAIFLISILCPNSSLLREIVICMLAKYRFQNLSA